MNNFSSPGKGEKACFSTDISHTQPTNLLRIPDVDLGIKRGALVSLLYQQSRTCDSPGPPHPQNLPSTSRAVPSAPLRGPPCSATALPAVLGQEEQNGCQKARGTQQAAAKLGAGPAVPSYPVSWLPSCTSAEFHLVQGKKGLGDALTSARYQLHCHVTDIQSNTNCKGLKSLRNTSQPPLSSQRSP